MNRPNWNQLVVGNADGMVLGASDGTIRQLRYVNRSLQDEWSINTKGGAVLSLLCTDVLFGPAMPSEQILLGDATGGVIVISKGIIASRWDIGAAVTALAAQKLAGGRPCILAGDVAGYVSVVDPMLGVERRALVGDQPITAIECVTLEIGGARCVAVSCGHQVVFWTYDLSVEMERVTFQHSIASMVAVPQPDGSSKLAVALQNGHIYILTATLAPVLLVELYQTPLRIRFRLKDSTPELLVIGSFNGVILLSLLEKPVPNLRVVLVNSWISDVIVLRNGDLVLLPLFLESSTTDSLAEKLHFINY